MIELDYEGYYLEHSDKEGNETYLTYENDDGKKLIITIEEVNE